MSDNKFFRPSPSFIRAQRAKVAERPKQPNMAKADIIKEVEHLRTPEQLDIVEEWLKTRPPKIQEMARKFPQYQLYRVKEGAPYRFTCEGCVVSVFSFLETDEGVELRMRVLQSPIGTAGLVAEIDPFWLEPITLDELEDYDGNSSERCVRERTDN